MQNKSALPKELWEKIFSQELALAMTQSGEGLSDQQLYAMAEARALERAQEFRRETQPKKSIKPRMTTVLLSI